jgi:hypothetical protein
LARDGRYKSAIIRLFVYENNAAKSEELVELLKEAIRGTVNECWPVRDGMEYNDGATRSRGDGIMGIGMGWRVRDGHAVVLVELVAGDDGGAV